MQTTKPDFLSTWQRIRPVLLVCCATLALLTACASSTNTGEIGITRQQFLLISASQVEEIAAQQYTKEIKTAKAKGKLLTKGAEITRLKEIANRLIPQASIFRDDTSDWNWQVSLIDAPVLNATCAPGGKITFYTGIIRQLHLSDAEIAAIMGHEIAHALREHGRERASYAMAQQLIGNLALATSTDPKRQTQVAVANQIAHFALMLPNSRTHEREADEMGLELMARAGYNPQAAIQLWQKMSKAGGASPPEFLSTHPSNASRIEDIEALIPVVYPLYVESDRRN